MSTKLKQHLIWGLDLTQRCRTGLDRGMHRKLFLRCEDKKIATPQQQITLNNGQ